MNFYTRMTLTMPMQANLRHRNLTNPCSRDYADDPQPCPAHGQCSSTVINLRYLGWGRVLNMHFIGILLESSHIGSHINSDFSCLMGKCNINISSLHQLFSNTVLWHICGPQMCHRNFEEHHLLEG